MGKLISDVLKTISAIIKELPKGNSVRIERRTSIDCHGCKTSTMANVRVDIATRGVWVRDPIAPDGWGIRYKRREHGAPIATYYCSGCAQKLSGA